MSLEVRRMGEGQLELVGISHKTAPIDVLERLALTRDEVRALVERLEATGLARDVAVLSTCNRTEIYVQPAAPEVLDGEVLHKLREVVGGERFPTEDYLYRVHGREAAMHLFRVACGLDSLVVGEAQILGQVKDAFEETVTHRPPSRTFDEVFRAALKVGGKARAETEIGQGAVSVASAAVHLATRFYADMSRQSVLVIGAGDTGRLVAEHMKTHEPKRLLIVNRTFERAERLAREVGGEAIAYEALAETLTHADIIVCAVRVTAPLVTREAIERANEGRAGRPLLLLDLGLPRNIDPEVGSVANVFVHDIGALKQVVDANLSRRRKELPRVEAIIDASIAAGFTGLP
ncbi:MAG: glutamyl-tRNA reductase, partial [Myxococcota bacterium]